MKQAMKIKGILAMADVTYEEFAKLIGITRQTLHKYLNDPDIFLDDNKTGKSIIRGSSKLMQCVSNGALPLTKPLTKAEKMAGLEDAIKSDA